MRRVPQENEGAQPEHILRLPIGEQQSAVSLRYEPHAE